MRKAVIASTAGTPPGKAYRATGGVRYVVATMCSACGMGAASLFEEA